jgi:hypothetical protein
VAPEISSLQKQLATGYRQLEASEGTLRAGCGVGEGLDDLRLPGVWLVALEAGAVSLSGAVTMTRQPSADAPGPDGRGAGSATSGYGSVGAGAGAGEEALPAGVLDAVVTKDAAEGAQAALRQALEVVEKRITIAKVRAAAAPPRVPTLINPPIPQPPPPADRAPCPSRS